MVVGGGATYAPDPDDRRNQITVGSVGLSPGAIHHSVVVVRDLDQSVRFYRDGIGLDVLMDHEIEGDWPTLSDRSRGHPDGAGDLMIGSFLAEGHSSRRPLFFK